MERDMGDTNFRKYIHGSLLSSQFPCSQDASMYHDVKKL